jgi:S-disulfanyl-L-cysteine oxidoreductase SoxD
VLSNENFLDVDMPNADGFIVDDRPDTEYPIFTEENACYENCKDSVEITKRATVLDVTPVEDGTDQAAAEPASEAAPVEVAVAQEAPVEAPAEVMSAAFDADLAAKGETVFKKCKACHQTGEGAKNKTGPVLNGVFMAPVAHVDDFKYSNDLMGAHEAGVVWDEAHLADFLAKPKSVYAKTKMTFAGLNKDSEIAAVIEYLKSVSQ